MNLLDKLSAVTVTADTRITAVDRDFCQAHQKAYEMAKQSLSELGAMYADVVRNLNEILPVKSSLYDSVYISIDKLSEKEVNSAIEGLHERFIDYIVRYFNDTYNVSIEQYAIKSQLLPKEPVTSGWNIDIEAHERYHEELLNKDIKYEDILDALLEQLGDRSFTERALDEIKEACHNAAWNSYNGKAEFEVKGDSIRFTSWACSYENYGFGDRWNLEDKMRGVIRGLAHFETGVFSLYPSGMDELLSYSSLHDPIVEFEDCRKIVQLKMFKNRRVDIKFASPEYARQFADEYLGEVC